MKINFFDRESVIQSFAKLYGIEESTLVALSKIANLHEDPTAYFLSLWPVKLDEVDVSNVELHCKHITTAFDELKSFQKYGFLTLQKALECETPLKSFLEQRGIVFNLETRKVIYREKDVWFVEGDEECKECFYGTECQHKKSIFSDNETLRYRDYACPYREAIKVLRSKIYHDKGQIEVHLSGSFKDVHDYSEVKYYPEILNTIERMINKLFDEKVALTSDWKNLSRGKYYCLDFDVNIEKFEYITSYPFNDWFWYTPFFKYCAGKYYSLDDANSNFYGNLYLLSTGIPIICDETPVRYGQITTDLKISLQDIKVKEYFVTSNGGEHDA